MRLHLVALPHVRLGTPISQLCAYSGKVEKFCRMMGEKHEVYLYAPESDKVRGARNQICCLSENARLAIFGKDDPARLPAWPTDSQAKLFNLMAAAKIAEIAHPGDLILLAGGRTHKPIADSLPEFRCVEPFVGYTGIFTDRCAFESYSHMSTVYAKEKIENIRWFDTVIPPFCDAADFSLNEGKGKYLLFLGRVTSRKGPAIAMQIAAAAGLPLYVAGAGACGAYVAGKLLEGDGCKLEGDVTYLGPVGVEERAMLLAGARALIAPTIYIEPGGNVAIEAMLAGTPVIAPDSGVFSETVQHGVSGFHFRLFREAVDAVENCGLLQPQMIRQYAVDRYSLEAIAPKYDRWLENVVRGQKSDGWYAQ